MARPDWIPKDVWKFIKHGKRPKCIPKPIWKMLKAGVKNALTKEAVKLLIPLVKAMKIFPF
jgi:hypothetical protein